MVIIRIYRKPKGIQNLSHDVSRSRVELREESKVQHTTDYPADMHPNISKHKNRNWENNPDFKSEEVC